MSLTSALTSLPFPRIPSGSPSEQEEFFKGLRNYFQSFGRLLSKENLFSTLEIKAYQTWISVTGDTVKKYVSGEDWRGRVILGLGLWENDTVANCLLKEANDGGLTNLIFSGPGLTGADVSVLILASASGTLELKIEGDTGKLFVIVTGYSADFQVLLLLLSSGRFVGSNLNTV
jgi:hypothetical protein